MALTTGSSPLRTPIQQTPKPTSSVIHAQKIIPAGSDSISPKKAPTCSGGRASSPRIVAWQ